MTIAFWCVLVMILFPYVFTILAKSGGRYNNQDPRQYLENTTGWRKRAHYVQLNTFETTPAFAIAVIIAYILKAPQNSVDLISITYVISRIAYAICYLTDKPTLRSLIFFIGLGCVISLFYLAA